MHLCILSLSDGVLFNEKPCKKTVDVSFESLLDGKVLKWLGALCLGFACFWDESAYSSAIKFPDNPERYLLMV